VLGRLFTPVEVSADLPVSRERLFEVLADPTTYPDWLVGAQRIRRVDPAFPAPTTGFDHSVGPTPEATVDDSTRSVESDPPRRLVLDVHAGPIRAIVTFHLEEIPTGTHLRFLETPTGHAAPFTPVLRPVLYARNAESLRRLRGFVDRR
jgi:uncharacterized protein YndB with AHSA1/START domain